MCARVPPDSSIILIWLGIKVSSPLRPNGFHKQLFRHSSPISWRMWGHFQSQQGGDDKARIPRIVGRVASLSLSMNKGKHVELQLRAFVLFSLL
nr:hypothetical protein Q903MT_gene3662 [Picea sitchensis]